MHEGVTKTMSHHTVSQAATWRTPPGESQDVSHVVVIPRSQLIMDIGPLLNQSQVQWSLLYPQEDYPTGNKLVYTSHISSGREIWITVDIMTWKLNVFQ